MPRSFRSAIASAPGDGSRSQRGKQNNRRVLQAQSLMANFFVEIRCLNPPKNTFERRFHLFGLAGIQIHTGNSQRRFFRKRQQLHISRGRSLFRQTRGHRRRASSSTRPGSDSRRRPHSQIWLHRCARPIDSSLLCRLIRQSRQGGRESPVPSCWSNSIHEVAKREHVALPVKPPAGSMDQSFHLLHLQERCVVLDSENREHCIRLIRRVKNDGTER